VDGHAVLISHEERKDAGHRQAAGEVIEPRMIVPMSRGARFLRGWEMLKDSAIPQSLGKPQEHSDCLQVWRIVIVVVPGRGTVAGGWKI
jgi:hypothetical protein